jgi:hypothetical protein
VTLRRDKINTLGAEFSENAAPSGASTPHSVAAPSKVAVSSISSDSAKKDKQKSTKKSSSKDKSDKAKKDKPPKDDAAASGSASTGGRLRGLTKLMRTSAAPGTIGMYCQSTLDAQRQAHWLIVSMARKLLEPITPKATANAAAPAGNFPPPPATTAAAAPAGNFPPPPATAAAAPAQSNIPAPPPPPPPMASSKSPSTSRDGSDDVADAENKKPQVKQTSLLDAIQKGVTLRKAEIVDEAPAEDAAKATISQILARRVAMEDSDSGMTIERERREMRDCLVFGVGLTFGVSQTCRARRRWFLGLGAQSRNVAQR